MFVYFLFVVIDVLNIFEKPFVERVLAHGGSIAEYDEFHARSSNGYVHTTEVFQESYFAIFVGTYHI